MPSDLRDRKNRRCFDPLLSFPAEGGVAVLEKHFHVVLVVLLSPSCRPMTRVMLAIEDLSW